jgi:hypothetical protein
MTEPTFLEIIEADSKRINELTAENEELKKENEQLKAASSPIECYQSVFGLNTAWPITEVLKKLIEAAEILLNNKNYDGHGWEEIYHATIKAKELEISINNWLSSLPLPVAPIECYVPVSYEEEKKINEDSMGVIHSEIGWLKKVSLPLHVALPVKEEQEKRSIIKSETEVSPGVWIIEIDPEYFNKPALPDQEEAKRLLREAEGKKFN